MTDYSELLKKAREQLPQQISEKVRFEIPRLDSAIVGSRTMIKNFIDAVTVIRREPEHLLKFFTKELAAPGNIEGKAAVFQGKFPSTTIDSKFNKYLETYVICSECEKADTRLIKEERLTFLKCEACGVKKLVRR